MDEHQLLKKFRNNDSAAFKKIYDEFYYLVLYRINEIVNSIPDAEELTNDVFMKVKDNCDEIDSRNGLRFWLHRVATNAAIDHYRRLHAQKVIKTEELDAKIESVKHEDTNQFNEIEAELWELIYKEIDKQPKKRRSVYMLLLEGLTISEVAERLHIKESTAYKHKMKIEKILREKLGNGSNNIQQLILFAFFLQALFQLWQKYF
jgi:RNA polymerase sigma-70 factor (ECF subfamily)